MKKKRKAALLYEPEKPKRFFQKKNKNGSQREENGNDDICNACFQSFLSPGFIPASGVYEILLNPHNSFSFYLSWLELSFCHIQIRGTVISNNKMTYCRIDKKKG